MMIRGRPAMSGQNIECPCGTVLRGVDEDAVIAEAQAHAKAVHDMDLSDDDARSMARPA
jgi:hypothetical protein